MDGRIYPWGDVWGRTRANTEDGGPGDTTPVGMYPGGASPYGLMDMAGNVQKWEGMPPRSPMYRPGVFVGEAPDNRGYMGERDETTGIRLVLAQ